MKAGRTTLREIAARAKVTIATVSYALRNHPSISTATRARIHSIAWELGYHPDPLLTHLMSYLRTGDSEEAPYRSTIAYLHDFPDRKSLHQMYTYDQFFRGAKQRAGNLGFRLEELWLREPDMNETRMTQILLTRGIRGVIVAPAPDQVDHPAINWQHFSSVVIGHTQWEPLLHRVSNNQIHSLRLALEKMRALGYERIGCAFAASNDAMLDHNWYSAFLVDQQKISERNRVPIFLTDDWSAESFREWFRTVRPDAIIGFQMPVLAWLQEMRMKIPEEIGFAAVDRFPAEPPLAAAGIDQNSSLIGSAAVDLVASQIMYNEQGIPLAPKLLLLEGAWQPGPTVRVQGKAPATRKRTSASRAVRTRLAVKPSTSS